MAPRATGTELGGRQGTYHESGCRVLRPCMERYGEWLPREQAKLPQWVLMAQDGVPPLTQALLPSSAIHPFPHSIIHPFPWSSPPPSTPPHHFLFHPVLSNSLINPQTPGWKAAHRPCMRELQPGTRPSLPIWNRRSGPWATFNVRVPLPTYGYLMSEVEPMAIGPNPVIAH